MLWHCCQGGGQGHWKIVIPLKVGTAKAAEVARARLVAEVLGLVLTEQLKEQTATQVFTELRKTRKAEINKGKTKIEIKSCGM